MITKLYDTPGSWLVDHPNARRGVAAVVAGLTFAVAPVALAGHGKVTPGGVKEYKAPAAVGSSTLKD